MLQFSPVQGPLVDNSESVECSVLDALDEATPITTEKL